MPLNFYSFLIANMLAEKEFEEKKVPNKARSQQLGLVASVFSPSGGGGGLGSSVLPAVLVQQTARREADDAAREAANKAALSTGDTTPAPSTGGATVTRGEFQSLSTHVNTLEGLFVEYHDVKGRTFAEAKELLKEFHVLTVDELAGKPVDDTKQTVKTQFPEFRPGMRLLRGTGVAIMEDASSFGRSAGDPGWGEKG